MIHVLPGNTFTAVLQGVATGLAGTLGVRIENTDGTNHTARATAGIVELEAGSGTYAKANLTAPTVKGTYVVLWDTGGGSPAFHSEELNVTYTLPVSVEGPVTLAEFKQYINVSRDDDDELLQRILDAAIEFAENRTGRRFGLFEGETITVTTPGKLLHVPDIRSLTSVAIDGEEVSTDDWRLIGTSDLELLADYVTSTNVVEVTGDFGLDPLPADLREAIVEEAANRYYDRTTGNADSANSEEYGGGAFSRPPGWARAVMDSYRAYSVVG